MAAECSLTVRYGDLCRLCAEKTNMVSGINIFHSEGALRQINKRIETCLPIQVHESDDLPKMICESCVYKLDAFFEFRERTLRTENVLITIFKDITSKIIAGHELSKISPSVEQPCLIAHPDLPDNMQNVNDGDLSQLQRDIIVHPDIILNHHSVDMNDHSLPNIQLSNLDLGNSSLSHQSVLTNSVNGGPYSDDNIQLIQQHHMLAEQYRLQELNFNIIHEESSPARSPSPNSHIEDERTVITKENIKLEHSLKKEYFGENQCSNVTIKSQPLVDFEESNSNESREIALDGQKAFVEKTLAQTAIENSNTSFYISQNQSANSAWIHCNMCGAGFIDKSEFERHYEQHFNKCNMCYAVFPTNEALNSHLKYAHALDIEEPANIKTKTRSKPTPSTDLQDKDSPIIDSNSESDGGGNNDTTVEEEEDEDDPETDTGESATIKRKKWSPKECKECGKLYKTNYKLVEHMRKHTGEKPYKCNSCDKAFRSKIGLAQHEAKHTGQYDLSCPTCGKGFQCKSYLMVHQRVHSDIKPYPCTTCGRNFKTKQSLLDHTNRHLGVKPYICDVCGRGFITKGLCKAHQKVHTGLDNRKYSCKVCHKMFVSKSYLQTHLRIHTGEKPFICEVCGKGFLTRVDLRIHSTMHTGEKSFVCEMCGKAFARRDALRCHRRSHTGERPYKCDLCGQTFTQFSPMAIHKRLHTGERPYTCDVCGKSFVSRSTMMSHWKKHDNKQ